ncbi:YggS family pyridoxal phosphate-dependent enzyme [Georgenia sp. Z1491]|uniref:YggS family pyridoxal phosphate-dependent enzyme n=1 Tax=Georgenia sp. Z1491 TaxID=3416707 RepID=UPI003CF98CFE
MTDLTARMRAVRERVVSAATDAGRDPREVRILVAVKTQPTEEILAALDAGATVLGHNRVDELAGSGPALSAPDVLGHEMHLIGHLQSNKINAALPWTTCVQSIESTRRARKIDEAVGRRLDAGEGIGPRRQPRPLDVMIQVNTSREPTKHGVDPESAVDLAAYVGERPHLRLTGLMTIGANSPDAGLVRASYTELAELRERIGQEVGGLGALELSMGMSGDIEPAVAAGATIVRVGTAVFGPRPAPARPDPHE